jgi:hypothetical protein
VGKGRRPLAQCAIADDLDKFQHIPANQLLLSEPQALAPLVWVDLGAFAQSSLDVVQLCITDYRAQTLVCSPKRQCHREAVGELEHDDFLLDTENRSALPGRNATGSMPGINNPIPDRQLHTSEGSDPGG